VTDALSATQPPTATATVWAGFRPPLIPPTTPIPANKADVKGYVTTLFVDTIRKNPPVFAMANKQPLKKNTCCLAYLDDKYVYAPALSASKKTTVIDMIVNCAVGIKPVDTSYEVGSQSHTSPIAWKRRQQPATMAPSGEDVEVSAKRATALFNEITKRVSLGSLESDLKAKVLECTDAASTAGTAAFIRTDLGSIIGSITFGRHNIELEDHITDLEALKMTLAPYKRPLADIVRNAATRVSSILRIKNADSLDMCIMVNEIALQAIATILEIDASPSWAQYLVRRWIDRTTAIAQYGNVDDVKNQMTLHRETKKTADIAVMNELSNEEVRLMREFRQKGVYVPADRVPLKDKGAGDWRQSAKGDDE
jgi:hypothetical protein